MDTGWEEKDREGKWLAQSHVASLQQSQEKNPDLCALSTGP